MQADAIERLDLTGCSWNRRCSTAVEPDVHLVGTLLASAG
jgi:hypothetical protein